MIERDADRGHRHYLMKWSNNKNNAAGLCAYLYKILVNIKCLEFVECLFSQFLYVCLPNLSYLFPEAVRPEPTAFPTLSCAPRSSPAGLSDSAPQTGRFSHLVHTGIALPTSTAREAHR